MNKYFLCILPVLFLSFQLIADVDTTSKIRGSVNVEGASVQAVHLPTGTTKTDEVSESGRFNISFLPIGGPYEVTISADGYISQSVTISYLSVSAPAEVKVNLLSSDDLENVVVTAAQLSGTSVSSGTSLSRYAIDGIPSVSRNIGDYVKFDPRVSFDGENNRDAEISVMGNNARFNDFSIDGISFNDPFGLNDNGFATMKNPISMDFIEEISVDITPYDVSVGGATGGSIIAITKSGTNEFTGSAYFSSRDESNVGDLPNGSAPTAFDDELYSFTFSGPIIKDRLHFFVGFESSELTSSSLWGTSDSGAANTWPVTTAEMQAVSDFMSSTYGYDTGPFNMVSYPMTQEQTILKLNGVINDKHRVEFLYQFIEDSFWELYDNYTTDITFKTGWYEKPIEQERISFTLFSDLTDRLSTSLKISSYDFFEDDGQADGGYGGLFPQFRISGMPERHNLYVGSDRYRGANVIDVESSLISFKANYDLDDHQITFGFDSDKSDLLNVFIPRYSGEIRFASLDDFYNHFSVWEATGETNYTRLRANIPSTGNSLIVDDPSMFRPKFSIEETNIYIQDEWQVNDRLSVQYGVRHQEFEIPEQATINTYFQSRYGVVNNSTVDYSITQPRFSFNMDTTGLWFGDRVVSSSIEGGYGLFAGRLPRVYFGNAFSRTNVDSDYVYNIGQYGPSAGPIPNLNTGAVTGITDPRFFWTRSSQSDYVYGQNGYRLYAFTHFTDPNFEGPSTYKSNIALNLQFANGYDVRFEYNKDSVNKALMWKDLSYSEEGTLADGRALLDQRDNPYLTTTGEGGGEALSIIATKAFDNGVNLYAGYTNMEMEDASRVASAQADSAYNKQPHDIAGENLRAAPSDFMVDDKLIIGLDYTTQIFGTNDTRFSVLANRKSGRRYSLVYETGDPEDSITDGNWGAFDLIYVPTGVNDPNVVFASDAVASSVMNFLSSGCAAGFSGQIMTRNACKGDYATRIDLRITQDIQVNDDQKIVIYFDIQNLMNFLEEDKGWQTEIDTNSVSRAVSVDLDQTTALGQLYITGINDDAGLIYSTDYGQSQWQMNLGISYKF